MNIKTFASEIGKITAAVPGVRGLGEAFSVVAQAIANSATALGVFGVVLAAAIAAYAALDKMHVSYQDAVKQAQASAQTYQSTKAEIESINGELTTTQEKIDDLRAKGSLTFTEQEELANLESQNQLLQTRLEIQEKLAEYQGSKAAADANAAVTNQGFSILDNGDAFENTFANGWKAGWNGDYARIVRQGDSVDYVISKQEYLNDLETDYQDILNEIDNTPVGTKQYDQLVARAQEVRDEIVETQNDIATKAEEVNGNYDLIASSPQFAETKRRIDEMNDALLGPEAVKQRKIDDYLSLPSLQDYIDKAKELAETNNGITADQIIEQFPRIGQAASAAGMDIDEFAKGIADSINSAVGTINIDEAISQMRKSFTSKAGSVSMFDSLSDEWDAFVSGLSADEIKLLYGIYSNTDTSAWSIDDWKLALQGAVEAAEEASHDIAKAMSDSAAFVSNLSTVQGIVNGYGTGSSTLTAEQYSSDALKDYTDALEYVNGAYTLNAEKVREIAVAKGEEQIAINNTNKALKQEEYTSNAAKIEQLRHELATTANLTDEVRAAKEAEIRSLLSENAGIKAQCDEYNLLNASIREATDAYHNWLNAQNASQSGDMFDSSLSAFQMIDDVLNNTDSDLYGRVGRSDYQAAVEFLIPDSIDSDDEAAINSYMDSIDHLFQHDDNGNRTGLDISSFVSDASEAGLLVYDESAEAWNLAGQMTMEEFAKGMNLSLPLVQAMIGEIEEFQKESPFKWLDDATPTMGDLAVAANEAAEKLRGLEGNEDLEIRMNFSGLADEDAQFEALGDTIKQMQDLKAKVDVDSSEAEYANEVIAYCVAQQQLLNEPAVMRVDTSSLDGDTATAISTLQQFQAAVNELELQQQLGLDTTEAQASVDALTAEVQSLDTDTMIQLGIDATSVETIQSSLAALDEEHLISIGIDPSAIDEYEAPDEEADVVYHVNDTAVKSYTPANKTGTVVYSAKALPWTPPKYTTTMTVSTVYSGSSSKTTSSGSTSSGSKLTSALARHLANGTAHAHGTAAASGDWGTAPGGKTLVGELGREIVVDPYSGKWYTVGDNGAEFTYVPRGAIVFNHLQSESLLKNGYTIGRASALASGTAMALPGAGIKTKTIDYNTQSYSGSSTSSSDSSSSSSSSSTSTSSSETTGASDVAEDAEEALEAIDWIEVAIDRITRTIDKLAKTATSTFTTLAKRLSATYDEIDKTEQSIALQEKAYARYMEQAESVGLSSDLAEKVRNGEINIEDYDEDCREFIQEYQNWYEKALDVSAAIDDLHLSLAQLYQDNFDNQQEDFENQLSLLEHMTNRYQFGIENFELHGYLESTKFYEAMSKVGNDSIVVLENELNALTASMTEALQSGEIEEYSAEWYAMQQAINGVKEQIDETNNSLVEYGKTMREIEWGHFDFLQERISQLTSEADFLIDLIGDDNLYQDSGQLNDQGLTAMGLHGQNYNVYMNQADKYAAELLKVNKQLAKDPNNTDIIKRREELLSLQQKSILAAEEEKDAIVDLVEGGIKIELSNLKELIDTYIESLNSAKDLYEYNKKVRDQTSEIASLQKQLSAYRNDTSEETRARVQKLQVELADAQENLRETEYQQYISDQKKLLDNLYTEYEATLNQRLDNIDLLISDMTDTINANADIIYNALKEVGADVGYALTPELNAIWQSAAEKITEIKNALVNDPGSLANMLISKMEAEGLISHGDAENLRNALASGDPNSAVSKIVNQLIAEGKVSATDAQLLQNAISGTNQDSVISRIVAGEGVLTTYSADFKNTMTGVKSVIDSIDRKVAGMVGAGDEKAEEEYTSPQATSASTPPSSSVPKSDPGDKPIQPEEPKKESPPSLSKGSLVSLKPGTWWYYDSYGSAPAGSADYWLGGKQAKIGFINEDGSHAYGLVDPDTGGYWGWVRKTDIVGYRSGGMNYDTGLAMLHGTSTKPEAVLNAEDTENFLGLRDRLREISKSGMTIDNLAGDAPRVSNGHISDVVESVLGGMASGGIDTSTNIGDINISIPIAHVEDYNDLVYKMQHDGKFENMILDMTVNRIAGKSSLSKYKQDFRK